MLISPDEVKAKAKSKENENYAFRTYLKMHADPLKLDEQFRKLHEELFSGYDCSQCRNCCKMYCGMIPQEDIEKAAGQFSMSGKDFVERFLEYDLGEMSYKTKHCPCDFLKDDGACALGDCKPINCRRYPYTDQIGNCFEKTSGMAGSLYGKADAGVCSHSGGPGLAS